MNTKKLILTGAITGVGILGLASIGVAFADSGTGGPAGWSMMGGHHTTVADQQTPAAGCDQIQDQMQAAIAKALGITVDDLNAQLAAGKTVADIATAKGLDFSTVMQTAMTAVHGDLSGGYGPGMMGGIGRGTTGGQGYGPGMMGGRGTNIN
jgi:hypothetical protein